MFLLLHSEFLNFLAFHLDLDSMDLGQSNCHIFQFWQFLLFVIIFYLIVIFLLLFEKFLFLRNLIWVWPPHWGFSLMMIFTEHSHSLLNIILIIIFRCDILPKRIIRLKKHIIFLESHPIIRIGIFLNNTFCNFNCIKLQWFYSFWIIISFFRRILFYLF